MLDFDELILIKRKKKAEFNWGLGLNGHAQLVNLIRRRLGTSLILALDFQLNNS